MKITNRTYKALALGLTFASFFCMSHVHAEDQASINKDTFKGRWEQLKGSVQENWAKLTDKDLRTVQGKKDRLIGLIQEKYGETKEAIEQKIDELLEKNNK